MTTKKLFTQDDVISMINAIISNGYVLSFSLLNENLQGKIVNAYPVEDVQSVGLHVLIGGAIAPDYSRFVVPVELAYRMLLDGIAQYFAPQQERG